MKSFKKTIDELKALKVNIKLITDGDVAGALLVSDNKYNIDIFLGISCIYFYVYIIVFYSFH